LSRLTKKKREKQKENKRGKREGLAAMLLFLSNVFGSFFRHAVSSTAGCSFFFSFSPQEEMAK
jgi:hypothetical protein